MRRIAMLGVFAGLLVVGVPGAIADGGPTALANCTFSKGTTVCSTTTSTASTVTTTDPSNGCTITTPVTTTVTTFSVHRGAPNSNGEEVAAPPPVTTQTSGTPSTTSCPSGGTGIPVGGV